jgi:peptidoglycan hydrolase CwlO-like protein
VVKTETQSRYEVISNLEEQKRSLIRERDGLQDRVKEREFEIKQYQREIEDKTENLNEFKKTLEERKATICELIKSVDESLRRISTLQTKQ